MNKLNIGPRLGLAFAFVLALMAVIVVIALARMSSLNDGTSAIINSYPKITAAYTIEGDLNQVALSTRNMLLMKDEAAVKAEGERIAKARTDISAKMEFLEKEVSSDKGKAALKELKEARAAYVADLEQLLKLVGDKNIDESTPFLLGKMRQTQAGYFDKLEAFIATQDDIFDSTGMQAKATYDNAKLTLSGIALAALAIAGVMALLVTRSIVRPLGQALDAARKVAAGDLTIRLQSEGNDEAGQLIDALRDMNASLVRVVGTVRQGSESVATASAEIAQGNNDLSARTEQQASALEETAASMEELSSTVKQNADSARQANQLAMNASTVAVQGGEVVSQVVDTMKGINDSSRKISDIISVIDGIAFQTNILALNAAVEAARAGEQGRGFAVVASEVRSLAGRSAEAAKEIKTLISASVERVEHGTHLVDKAGATMTEVVTSIRRVTDIMGEISAASAEQSAGVSQVGEAVSQMDQVTQQNAALVEEMAAAASSLKSQANDLVQTVAVFKLDANDTGAGLPKVQVRSPKPAPFKGNERRADAKPAPAAPRPAPAKMAAPKPKAAAPASLPKPLAPKVQPKPAPAGGDDEWETF